jgi:hypothetical protein
MRIRVVALCLSALLSAGCVARGPVGSFCGPLPEQHAVAAMAADAVACLSAMYPPGRTTLRLLPAEEADNAFAAALESGLRAKGFTLAAPNSSVAPDAVTLAYTLDALDEKSAWYLQLRLSDGKAAARVYTAAGRPEAGQSRTIIESLRSGLERLADAAKEKAGRAYDAARALTE